MDSIAEEWLEQHTFYCSRLRARITHEQCEANRRRANSDGLFFADKMPGVSLKHCRGCPGPDSQQGEEGMPSTPKEPGWNERKCNVCGRIKKLESHYRPTKGMENQIDPKRVKTCIRCERKHGWCPPQYMDFQDIEEPINCPSTTETPTVSEQDSVETADQETKHTFNEWEDLTIDDNNNGADAPNDKPFQSPTDTEDPLANATQLRPLQQYTSSGAAVARLNNKGRDLYLSSLACKEFKILQYACCDFYLAADQQTPLIHLHDNPGRNSRKLAVDNKKSGSAAHVSCIAYAKLLGWQPGQEWLVEGTARSDVIKLVAKAEQ